MFNNQYRQKRRQVYSKTPFSVTDTQALAALGPVFYVYTALQQHIWRKKPTAQLLQWGWRISEAGFVVATLSYDDIAKATGIHRRQTIAKYVHLLERVGLIKAVRGEGRYRNTVAYVMGWRGEGKETLYLGHFLQLFHDFQDYVVPHLFSGIENTTGDNFLFYQASSPAFVKKVALWFLHWIEQQVSGSPAGFDSLAPLCGKPHGFLPESFGGPNTLIPVQSEGTLHPGPDMNREDTNGKEIDKNLRSVESIRGNLDPRSKRREVVELKRLIRSESDMLAKLPFNELETRLEKILTEELLPRVEICRAVNDDWESDNESEEKGNSALRRRQGIMDRPPKYQTAIVSQDASPARERAARVPERTPAIRKTPRKSYERRKPAEAPLDTPFSNQVAELESYWMSEFKKLYPTLPYLPWRKTDRIKVDDIVKGSDNGAEVFRRVILLVMYNWRSLAKKFRFQSVTPTVGTAVAFFDSLASLAWQFGEYVAAKNMPKLPPNIAELAQELQSAKLDLDSANKLLGFERRVHQTPEQKEAGLLLLQQQLEREAEARREKERQKKIEELQYMKDVEEARAYALRIEAEKRAEKERRFAAEMKGLEPLVEQLRNTQKKEQEEYYTKYSLDLPDIDFEDSKYRGSDD